MTVTDYNGFGGQSRRRNYMPVSTSGFTINAGNITNSVDDSFGNFGGGAAPGSWTWSTGQSTNGLWIRWDFGVFGITAKEFKWYQQGVQNHGAAEWSIQGSNDGTNWDDLATGQVLGGSATTTVTLTNSTRYRYIRMLGTNAGTTSSAQFLQETEFQSEYDDYEAGDRQTLIAVSTDLTKTALFSGAGGDMQFLVNGTGMDSSANEAPTFDDQTVSGKSISFTFDAQRSLAGFALTYTGNNSDLSSTFTFQYHDGSSWVDHQTGISLDAVDGPLGAGETRAIIVEFDDLTPFASQFRLLGTSGSISNNPWYTQMYFKVDAEGPVVPTPPRTFTVVTA